MRFQRKLWLVLVVLLAAGGSAGCDRRAPNLRVDPSAGDKTMLPGGGSAPPEIKVVSGENLTTLDDKEEESAAAEDKTGAVAVKMEY